MADLRGLPGHIDTEHVFDTRRPWREMAAAPMQWHAIRPGRGKTARGIAWPARHGVCVLCGARCDPLTDYNASCPNPRGLTRAEAMMLALGSLPLP